MQTRFVCLFSAFPVPSEHQILKQITTKHPVVSLVCKQTITDSTGACAVERNQNVCSNFNAAHSVESHASTCMYMYNVLFGVKLALLRINCKEMRTFLILAGILLMYLGRYAKGNTGSCLNSVPCYTPNRELHRRSLNT